jgi:hypothetical protein
LYRFSDFSFSRGDTIDTINAFNRQVKGKLKPAVVIIGLSLANEEMNAQQFMTNMNKLVEMVNAVGSACIIAGVYPNLYMECMYG